MPGRYRSDINRSGSSPERRAYGVLDEGVTPTAESLRLLRREIAASVAVVTTTDERGFRGVTVSAYTMVSLSPPRLLICLGAGSDALATIRIRGNFAVSVLGDRQEFIADQFAGRAPAAGPRLAGVKHRLTALGDPVLEDCLVWFSCAVDGESQQGDHTVIYGDVREAGFGSGSDPLLYFDGKYRYLQVD